MTPTYCNRCQKVSYPNRYVAEQKARRARRRRLNGENRMQAYRGECGEWHLGHRNVRSFRRRRK